jgi:tetratricopeptide (TPR) repeat protein
MVRENNPRRTVIIGAALSAVTLAVFWPLIHHDFISYDDAIYITENPHVRSGFTWENFTWAFQTGHGGNWHPITWLSHMLDVQIFGVNPGWHHLISAGFHTANTLLLFLLLKGLTKATWRSAVVAAFFAFHPLHVESVAWAAERKDVLSAFFGLLCLWSYGKYAELSGAQSLTRQRLGWYGLALFFFAFGLMSKPMLVTFPFVMLLLDFWPFRRFALADPVAQDANLPKFESPPTRDLRSSFSYSAIRPLLIEKLPFFALTIASCVATVLAQSGGGAVVPTAVLPLGQRVCNALIACAGYLEKTFWPTRLALFYPLHGEAPEEAVVVAGVSLCCMTALVFWRAARNPYLLVGWLWFLGMLVPTLGLVQVGMQQMADRYTYLPLIGVFVMLVWELTELLTALRVWTAVQASAAGLGVAVCGVLASRQIGYWQDTESIFGHTLKVTHDNYVALSNHGMAVFKKGRVAEAIQDYKAAIALAPELDVARTSLGEALVQQGKYDEAIEQFTKVLELEPANPAARLQLGVALSRQGKLDEAVEAFSEVLRQNPDDVGAHNNLGNVLSMQGRNEAALEHFAEAVRLQPAHASAQNNLAIVCKKLGRTDRAIACYREALRLQPNFLEALNNLAWTLATAPEEQYRNGSEAVRLATGACEMTQYQQPIPLTTLAAAYAESGDFPDAISFAERAQERVGSSQNPLAARLQAMVEAFRSGRPYREMKTGG